MKLPNIIPGSGLVEYIGGPFDGEIVDVRGWSPLANMAHHVRDGYHYPGISDGKGWWFVYD